MNANTNLFVAPRFRDGVVLTFTEESCQIRYRELDIGIDLEPRTQAQSRLFLGALKEGGQSEDSLITQFPLVGSEISDVLRELDRHGLLTETHIERPAALPGPQYFRELRRYIERAKQRYATATFYRGLLDGTVTREQIIGYAIEYYHIVRFCPGLIAPALSIHEPRATRDALLRFFVSELHHDEMLARALSAVNISREELDASVPLPMTFALCASLGVYARHHPLSFKAALFLFEQAEPAFNEALRRRCDAIGLPESFYQPILQHVDLNEGAKHDQITEILYKNVSCIGTEEQIVVKRHIGVMVESMVGMEQQILTYYSSPSTPIPRCFT